MLQQVRRYFVNQAVGRAHGDAFSFPHGHGCDDRLQSTLFFDLLQKNIRNTAPRGNDGDIPLKRPAAQGPTGK